MKKRGFIWTWAVIVGGVLAVVSLLWGVNFVLDYAGLASRGIDSSVDSSQHDDSFTIMDEAKNKILYSIDALKLAIQALAEGKSINAYDTEKVGTIESYQVMYWYEFEDDTSWSKNNHNSYDSTPQLKYPEHDLVLKIDPSWVCKNSEEEGCDKVYGMLGVANIRLKVRYYGKNEGSFREEEVATEGFDVGDPYGPNDLEEIDEDADCTDSKTVLELPGIRLKFCNDYESGKEGFIKSMVIPCPDCVKGQTTSRTGIFSGLAKKLGEIWNDVKVFFGVHPDKVIVTACSGGKILPGSNVPKDSQVCLLCNADAQHCAINNFELPQKITKDEAESWIKGYGDPELILYAEAFPQGEEEGWQVSQLSVMQDVVFFGAVMNAIPGIGAGLGKIPAVAKAIAPVKAVIGKVKEFPAKPLKWAVKEIEESYHVIKTGVATAFTKEAAEKLAKEGAEALAKREQQAVIVFAAKELSDDAFTTAIQKTGTSLSKDTEEYLAKVFGEAAAKAYDDVAEKGLVTKAGELTDDGIKLFTENLDHALPLDAAYVQAYKANINKNFQGVKFLKLSDELLEIATARARLTEFFAAKFVITESAERGVYKLNREALTEAFGKQLPSLLENINPQHINKLYGKSAGSFSHLVDKRSGAVLWHKVLKTSADDPRALALAADFNRFFVGNMQYDTVAKVLFTGAKGTLERLNPVAGGISPVALSLNPFTQIGKVSGWVGEKRYLLGLGIAMLASYSDSINEKYAPVGINSLGLATPSLLGEHIKFPLDPSSENIFLRIDKDGRDDAFTNRFFLASPCRTDLDLRRQKCTCKAELALASQEEGVYYLRKFPTKYGENPVPVKNVIGGTPGTVQMTITETRSDFARIGSAIGTWGMTEVIPIRGNRHYTLNTIEGGDISYAVRTCDTRGWWDRNIAFFNNIDTEADCITIATDESRYQEYNGGFNYCYTGENDGITAIKVVAFAAQVGIDIIVTAVAGATTAGAGAIIAAPLVNAATGAAVALLYEWLDDYIKWPRG